MGKIKKHSKTPESLKSAKEKRPLRIIKKEKIEKKVRKQEIETNKPLILRPLRSTKKDNIQKKLKKQEVETNKSLALRPLRITKKEKIQKKVRKQEVETNKSLVLSTVDVHIEDEDVKKVIDAIFELNERKKKEKRLFAEDKEIFLQVVAFKVPKCPNRVVKLPLVHSILTSESEVCLITADLKGETNEKTVEHYEDLLKSQGIKNIKRIIPIRELAMEYDQYEMKRKLVNLYDHFLVEGKVSGKVTHILGSIFRKKRKLPVCVNLSSNNLKDLFDLALRKVNFQLHSKGDNFLLEIGHLEMDKDEIVDNVFGVVRSLQDVFPGGWENVRSLYLKTRRTTSLPIYVSLKNKKQVLNPKVKAKRPRNYKKVRDEISTKMNTEVTVLPTGDVIVHNLRESIKK